MNTINKQALLDWLYVSIEGVPCKHVSIDLIREKIQSGAFDADQLDAARAKIASARFSPARLVDEAAAYGNDCPGGKCEM